MRSGASSAVRRWLSLVHARPRTCPSQRANHLSGEFTAEHAGRIARQLDEEDIVWWSKEPGYLSRIWEHGVRLFVDRTEVEHAREVARGVIGGEP